MAISVIGKKLHAMLEPFKTGSGSVNLQRKKGQLKTAHAGVGSTAFQRKLQFEFEQKRLKNPALSLRDFARILDMPVSTLTMLMRLKAKPTRTTIVKIAGKLFWDESEIDAFLADANRERNARRICGHQFETKIPEKNVLDRLLNLAIMTLARIEDHPASADFIGAKLGVAINDVSDSLQFLQEQGLIRIKDGVFQPLMPTPAFVADPADAVTLDYKRKFLTRAIDQLDHVDQLDSAAAANSNSILFYFSASPKDLELVRNRLGLFMKGLMKSLRPSKDDELYCAAALYFPFKK